MESRKSVRIIATPGKVSRHMGIDYFIGPCLYRRSFCTKYLVIFYNRAFSVVRRNDWDFTCCGWCTGCGGAGRIDQGCKSDPGKRTKYIYRACVLCCRTFPFCIRISNLDDVCFSCSILPGRNSRAGIASHYLESRSLK
jgi:hypothetical protein